MRNWKDTLVPPLTPIRKVLERIDASAIQIVLVVDAQGCLLGTVTDGDVRRGILKGISLDETVERVMRSKPVAVPIGESREKILSLMKEKKISKIPVLDENDRVIGIEVLDDLAFSSPKSNAVILMAGGLGSRLRPLTNDCPKPLLKVGQKPILETIIENFMEYGFNKFYLSVNYKDEMVKEYFGDGSRWNAKIFYINETQKLGTAGALSLLTDKPKEPLFVMNGDVLTKVNFQQLLDFHQEHKADATMCIREYDFQVPYGVVKVDKHKIVSIDEKPVHRFFVNAGIYLLVPRVLKSIPKNTLYDMPHLFEALIRKKMEVAAFPVREYWMDIGRIDDLERAQDDFSSVFK